MTPDRLTQLREHVRRGNHVTNAMAEEMLAEIDAKGRYIDNLCKLMNGEPFEATLVTCGSRYVGRVRYEEIPEGEP